MVTIAIPALVLLFLGVHRHYHGVARGCAREPPPSAPRRRQERRRPLRREARSGDNAGGLVRPADRRREFPGRPRPRLRRSRRSRPARAEWHPDRGAGDEREPRRGPPRLRLGTPARRFQLRHRDRPRVLRPPFARVRHRAAADDVRPSSSAFSPNRASPSRMCRSCRARTGTTDPESATPSDACSCRAFRQHRFGHSATRARSSSPTPGPSSSPPRRRRRGASPGLGNGRHRHAARDRQAPYRDVGDPLVHYVRGLTVDPNTVVSVVMPEVVFSDWRALLHNQHALYIKRLLLFEPRVILTSIPFHLP